ncbi:MAG: YdiU family protein [Dokdonella sp.]
MIQFDFDNAFRRELPGDPESGTRRREVRGAFWSDVLPTSVARPRLIAHSSEVAALLGICESDIASDEFANVFGGNALIEGMQPWAANYGGHQFGHWAGQLGDGRAISLGEVIRDGRRWELQLKGAGPTPYSRGADGRAVLRSSIREFLCSEAMHHLGIPTTRALSLVGTGESVVRDMFYDGNARAELGAVVCRVAPSFIRFGNFELPASRGDTDLVRQLADFTIRRDFPELDGKGENLYAEWFAQVCERNARMVAGWMRVGFVHGVLNTDNLSILGLTIDYGPYGWIDNFDPGWTPNTTDAERRRYRFGQQPAIVYWNLGRLAQALSSLFADPAPLHAGLQRFISSYNECERANTTAKLGLSECTDDDLGLMTGLQELMQQSEVDMTIWFRSLVDLNIDAPEITHFDDAFYSNELRREYAEALQAWLEDYAARVKADKLSAEQRRSAMRAANPRYVLRNYLAQQAIEHAEQGDESGISELLDVMRHPYDDQPGRVAFAAKRPDWARHKAGCSMLSCSS